MKPRTAAMARKTIIQNLECHAHSCLDTARRSHPGEYKDRHKVTAQAEMDAAAILRAHWEIDDE